MGRGRFQAFVQKIRPIVGLDGVEARHNIFERICFERGSASGAAVEGLAEIVEGFRAFTQLADQDVGFEPNERAFVIVVDTAAVSGVVVTGVIQKLRRNRQLTPASEGDDEDEDEDDDEDEADRGASTSAEEKVAKADRS